MKKFASKLILFAIIFLIFDKLFIIVANRSAETEVDKRLEYIVNGKMNKDIIVAGSSRGARDIIASQIEDSTGYSTYNLCYGGSNVDFHEFILRTLYKFNNPPKILLLAVDDPHELAYLDYPRFRGDRLYPLVKYSHIWKELAKREAKDRLFSSILILKRLNKSNFDLCQKRFTSLDTIISCGSMPITIQSHKEDWNYISSERIYPYDEEVPEKIKAFQNIIEDCKKHNIKLIVIFPPNYQTHSKSFEMRIRQLSDGGVFFYIYDMTNPIYRDKNFFYDKIHLRRNGAIIFTNEIIQYLNDNILEEGSQSLSKLNEFCASNY